MADVSAIASSVLGLSLRPSQLSAAEAVVAGEDTLAVLPTGSGKSAIYQVAGLALGGVTVVVSPLIALQRDQSRALAGAGLRAVMLNSSLHVGERELALAAVRDGVADFVMLGPEQLAIGAVLEELVSGPRPVTLVAVDEAHLVSEWGHDFRPDYLRVADAIDAFGRPTVLALTATAAPPVQADITRQLRMRTPRVIVADFDRPTIGLAVRRARHNLPEALALDDRTVEVVLAHDTPTLVYALTHAHCESLAERLRLDSYRAAAYHAGLPAAERARVQDGFFAGSVEIVVATSAFGMGIDKPDVRTVVHAGVPASLDEYYQEIGRAGRDGQPARAILVHDPRSMRIPRLLAARSRITAAAIHAVAGALEARTGAIALTDLAEASGESRHTVQRVVDELLEMGALLPDGPGTVRVAGALPRTVAASLIAAGDRRQAVLASRIDAARHYAETTGCRRADLLGYFGEHYEPPCGNCDNDDSGPAAAPATRSGLPGGVRVHHRLWGPGVLLSRDEHEVVVVFESVGYRHLTAAALTNGLLTED